MALGPTVQEVFDGMSERKKTSIYWVAGAIVDPSMKSAFEEFTVEEKLVAQLILQSAVHEVLGLYVGDNGKS